MAAARGLPIPPPDVVPPELEYRISPRTPDDPRSSDKNLKNLTVPISSRSQSYNSDSSSNLSPQHPAFSLPSPTSPLASPPSGSHLFRGRAKTLASLTTSSKNNSQTDMTPRELQLPRDPFINGQPIEAYLYKDASECPICFLYYPPYLNMTRCCDQPICSECFVQIKRPDPHPPEHEQPDANAAATQALEVEQDSESDGQFVSEPAACPFCKQPEFGITYAAPPFRKGLIYATASGSHALHSATSAMSSQSSLASAGNSTLLSVGPARRRATSLSATAPSVITTDRIRPDWATKLASARAQVARRSAAATALHTAAYLMGNAGGQTVDASRFVNFGRRGILRRQTEGGADSPIGRAASPHLNALALLAERHTATQGEEGGIETGRPGAMFLPPPRGSSSRRSRMDDLEDMMMMEAIRLSLASEEERRRKEEKDVQKETKKKEKERKKSEKAAKKSGLYTTGSNQSNAGFDSLASSSFGRVDSGSSSILSDEPPSTAKGKTVDRLGSSAPPFAKSQDFQESVSLPGISFSSLDQEQSPPLPVPSSLTEPQKRSHLRHMSNASSTASSFVDARSGSALDDPMTSNTPPGGSADTEPMFNFRSLAAMIGKEDEEKSEDATHVENAEHEHSINGRDDGHKPASNAHTGALRHSKERDVKGVDKPDNPNDPSLGNNFPAINMNVATDRAVSSETSR